MAQKWSRLKLVFSKPGIFVSLIVLFFIIIIPYLILTLSRYFSNFAWLDYIEFYIKNRVFLLLLMRVIF